MTPPPPVNLIEFFYLRPAPDIRPGTSQPSEEGVLPSWTAAAPLSRHVVQRRKNVGRPEENRDDPVSLRPGYSSAGVGVGVNV